MMELHITHQFKKDYKRIKKRGYDLNQLKIIIDKLLNEEPLPPKFKNHSLNGDWSGFYECHIQPDWLLIYQIDDNILVLSLSRTGSHSDLFQ